ncbi:uncharacterized protein [Physcomitrium patens]|uniref:uncharacterized protein isoform X4 n=1 Tax=Physcomitrium patens TaxID=3218 RepID=UPI003CCD1C56
MTCTTFKSPTCNECGSSVNKRFLFFGLSCSSSSYDLFRLNVNEHALLLLESILVLELCKQIGGEVEVEMVEATLVITGTCGTRPSTHHIKVVAVIEAERDRLGILHIVVTPGTVPHRLSMVHTAADRQCWRRCWPVFETSRCSSSMRHLTIGSSVTSVLFYLALYFVCILSMRAPVNDLLICFYLVELASACNYIKTLHL